MGTFKIFCLIFLFVWCNILNMTHNNKSIIHDINMEIVINSDEPISQTKKPEFNIDENMFKPSNIKNWSKIVLDTCDILSGDDLAYCENKIIIGV